MKRMAIGLVAALTLAACGGGASQASPTPIKTTAPTTAPTAAPTPAPTAARTAAPTAAPQTKVIFTADLKSSEENPPIANADAPCSGTATVTLDRAANSGVFEVDLKGCPATTEPTIMHIHRGAKGANGAVVVNSGLVAGEWKLTGGVGKITKNIATIDAALLTEIATTPAAFYFNVHSKENGGGVVRAQLTPKT